MWLFFDRFLLGLEYLTIVGFNFILRFVLNRQFPKLVSTLTQLHPISQLLDELLLLSQVLKLLLHDNMKDCLLIIVGQGGPLIDQHLEDLNKFLIDSDYERMGLIDLDVDLYNLSCTELMTLIKYSATS